MACGRILMRHHGTTVSTHRGQEHHPEVIYQEEKTMKKVIATLIATAAMTIASGIGLAPSDSVNWGRPQASVNWGSPDSVNWGRPQASVNWGSPDSVNWG